MCLPPPFLRLRIVQLQPYKAHDPNDQSAALALLPVYQPGGSVDEYAQRMSRFQQPPQNTQQSIEQPPQIQQAGAMQQAQYREVPRPVPQCPGQRTPMPPGLCACAL